MEKVFMQILIPKMNKFAGSIRTFSNFYESSRSTIYALATGSVRTALAVIRVSGPNCKRVLKTLGRYDSDNKLPNPRKATLRKLYDPTSRYMLDHGILLWFPGPNSYTGEDCCEFHVHGGSAVITGILKSMGSIPGCRMAEHGEFTKRAFLNGKMDLTEVEGLADLIEAETEMQRIQALKQLSGSLSRIYEGWRHRIAKILAHSEAFIDFGEDENMESGIMGEVESEARFLVQEIKSHLKDSRRGERLRTGVRIAIIGKPNVGKSSLLNLLCRRDAAIVSSIPGTTRDVIESCINLRGFPVIFADTAGIRPDTEDVVEAEGVRRSKNQIELADIVILLLDASDEASKSLLSLHCRTKIIDYIAFEDEKCVSNDDLLRKIEQKTLIVVNKVDLTEQSSGVIWSQVKNNKNFEMETQPFDSIISCKSLRGFDAFCDLITSRVSKLCGDPKEDSPCVTQERYRSELESCVQSLEQYLEHCSASVTPQNHIPGAGDLALRTNHLKNAISSIGAITGHYGSEEILDIVFRDFCIGK